MTGRTPLLGLVLALVLAACSPASSAMSTPGTSALLAADRTASPSPAALATPKPIPTTSPTSRPSLTTTATASTAPPPPTSMASTAPPSVSFKEGDVAVVKADAIRMRTEPSVDAGSDRYTPLLPKGTDLYVISGPKQGSGYSWYEVSPVSFKVRGIVEWPDTIIGDGMTGWVPAADRGGGAWLAHGDAACPPAPRDVESLARLTIGARLACFSQVPITLQARLLQHGCDVDWSGEMRPSWFQDATDGLTLVPATAATVSKDLGCDTDVLFLHLDPDGTRPARLPLDEVVTVTGTFDHPAAAACRFTPWDGATVDSDHCRYAFAVTSIR